MIRLEHLTDGFDCYIAAARCAGAGHDRKKARSAYDQVFTRDMRHDAYCTAAALVFLSDALQSPSAGFW